MPSYVVCHGKLVVDGYVNGLSSNSNHYHQIIIQRIYFFWTSLFYFCTSDGIIKSIVSKGLSNPWTKNNNNSQYKQALSVLPTILQLNDWKSRQETIDVLFSKPLIGTKPFIFRLYPCTLLRA
mgnify:CR=1 FL=1